MTEKNAELPQTSAAIAGLSDALARLNSAIGSKKDEMARKEKRYGAELKDSEARLELLKASSRKIIDNINTVMTRLDKVLENDGTSNDNN